MTITNYQSPNGGWGWVDSTAGVGWDPNGGNFSFTPGANPMLAIGSLTSIVNDAQAAGKQTYQGPSSGPAGQPQQTAAQPGQYDASSAQARGVLEQYELGELAPLVDRWIREGRSWDEIWLDLINPKTEAGQVVDRIYPELRQVRESGMPSITIADILNTRRAVAEGLSERGVSQYVDPRAIAREWTVKGVSVREGLTRVDTVLDDVIAFARSDPATNADLEAYERFYGVKATPQDLVGMALNPTLAIKELERRAASVRFDVEAGRAGFGDLSRQEAEGLTDLGVDARSSGGTFGALVQNRELFTALDRGEDAIGRDEQLGAAFGNSAAAQRRIEDRRRRRQAQFAGGGGFARTREGGFGGLSTAR